MSNRSTYTINENNKNRLMKLLKHKGFEVADLGYIERMFTRAGHGSKQGATNYQGKYQKLKTKFDLAYSLLFQVRRFGLVIKGLQTEMAVRNFIEDHEQEIERTQSYKQ